MDYYCPDDNTAVCNLNCGRKVSETCNSLTLYSINGGRNVHLTCSYYDSISIPFEPDIGITGDPIGDPTCFSQITMYCDPVYREYCKIDESIEYWTLQDNSNTYIDVGYNLTYFCLDDRLNFDCINYNHNPSLVKHMRNNYRLYF